MVWRVTVGVADSEGKIHYLVDAPKDARAEMIMWSMGETHADRLRSGETTDRIRPPFTREWMDD